MLEKDEDISFVLL